MAKIQKILLREVLDSRGRPTVEAEIKTDDGIFRSIAPSGTSKGKNEPRERREGFRLGKALTEAQRKVLSLIGKETDSPEEIDEFLGEHLAELGTNFTTAISQAVWKASGRLRPKALPTPMFNLVNGGLHGGGPAFQEFLFVPKGKWPDVVWMGAEVFTSLGEIVETKAYGLEGGYVIKERDPGRVVDLILKAAEKVGVEGRISLDVAAESCALPDEKILELLEELEGRIFTVEDPQRTLEKPLPFRVISDDLTVTDAARIRKVKDLIWGCIVKINQAGTVSKALEAITEARRWEKKVVVSHRSGDSEDTFLAEFGAWVGAEFIKAGAPSRGERTAKYNQLLRLWETWF